MNILVITRGTWDTDNNTGNTLSNYFGIFSGDTFFNIYCSEHYPKNTICHSYFQLSTKRMFKSLFKRDHYYGSELPVKINPVLSSYNQSELKERSKTFNASKLIEVFATRFPEVLAFFFELPWIILHWQSKQLRAYITENKIDVIFMPVFDAVYMHSLYQYVLKQTHAKGVLFFADDYYSYYQYSLSPLFWIRRFLIRGSIRKSLLHTSLCYTISKKMMLEYEQSLGIQSKVLNKVYDFSTLPFSKSKHEEKIKLVYAGNIFSGRWQTLLIIGKVLEELQEKEINAQIDIYTQNKLPNNIARQFNTCKCINLKGGVPNSQIEGILKNADILVHVESFGLKYRLQTRLSFSTKIVDYFYAAKCIFAVGNKSCASISHLIDSNAGIIAESKDEIKTKLSFLLSNRELISFYSNRSYLTGKKNNDTAVIANGLYKDLQDIVLK